MTWVSYTIYLVLRGLQVVALAGGILLLVDAARSCYRRDGQ